jgi:hypothetical protein
MITFKKSRCRKQHPRRTNSALRGAVAQKRILQTAEQGRAITQSLYSRDLVTFGLMKWNQARTNRLCIEQNCAGAAVSSIAAHLCTSEPEILAKDL